MGKSPMKMSYNGGAAPKGVAALSRGKGTGNETGPKVMKGARAAGDMYKNPSNTARLGRAADDKSSGNVKMRPQSKSDKTMYSQAVQPTQFSNNGQKATKFVC